MSGEGERSDFIHVIRKQDLLSLQFDFFNMKRNIERNPPTIDKIEDKDAFIVVHFPPQNITEQVFSEEIVYDIPIDSEPSTGLHSGRPPVRTLISGPSKLVFKLPDDIPSLPFTLKDLFQCKSFEQSIN